MGIKHLNSFLKINCIHSINRMSISELSNKKIAVDISIYMYKFIGENNLIQQMYSMLSTFKYYNIIPVFIFDGKPPIEKKELLKKRKFDKNEAEREYNKMKYLLEDDMIDEYEKNNIITNMENLKKKFLYINKEQIKRVKELIRSFGMTYYDAPREADELCSLLVIKKKVWACLSEDMDMFVYGCSRVLRYFNLLNHNVVLYNTKSILRELGITQKQFRQICVLSGTDYYSEVVNISSANNLNLNNTLILFKKYHKLKKDMDFYEWILMENKDYIKDYKLLNNIYNMFDLSENENMQNFEKINIINTPIMKDNIRKILEEEGIKCK